MHPSHPQLTIGRTVLKEFHDLDILGATFDSKITYEKHLRSVSRGASQRLGILRSLGKYSTRCFWGSVRFFFCVLPTHPSQLTLPPTFITVNI